MKCPKCGYVGFEALDRCRHCGYDFSLVTAPLPGEPTSGLGGPLDDFAGPDELFGTTPSEPLSAERLGFVDVRELERDGLGESPAADVPLVDARPSSLFDDAAPPPAPPPLAVRRAPDRPRTRTTTQVLRRVSSDLLAVPESPDVTVGEQPQAPYETAPLWRRGAAGLVDAALLGGIDLAVLYFTLRLAGLGIGDARVVPPLPFGAFLLGLNVAYLTVFTASGGQTLGKMALSVRAVSAEGPIPVSRALVRVVAAVAGGLLLGIGYLPVLFGGERRAVHDRLSDTRVVRAQG